MNQIITPFNAYHSTRTTERQAPQTSITALARFYVWDAKLHNSDQVSQNFTAGGQAIAKVKKMESLSYGKNRQL